MTETTMDVQALLGKITVVDFLREMIALAAQRLMDLQALGLTGASYGEKSADRIAKACVAAWLSAGQTINCRLREPASSGSLNEDRGSPSAPMGSRRGTLS